MDGSGRSTPTKRISLALQGGGTHGAFTWGVIDRILQDNRIDIEGFSGTSAGAMNGAVAAQGYALGGRQGARDALERFWLAVSEAGRKSLLRSSPLDRLFGRWNLDLSPGYALLMWTSRFLTPEQFNPSDVHPLRDILHDQLDFKVLRGPDAPALYISTTNVRTGKIRVFDNSELSIEALLASACIPNLFRPVEIDGEAYWDGGFMGNPALFPLIYNGETPDIVVIQINPLYRAELPRTAAEIMNRMHEISFNSSLMREMRSLAFVSRMIEEEKLDPQRYKRLNFHIIEADDAMNRLGVSSKLNTDWGFLTWLKTMGSNAASRWLDENFDTIGSTSSVDIFATFI